MNRGTGPELLIAGLWLPTGRIERFELTLRVYLPDDGGLGALTRDRLPAIVKEGC